MLERQQMRWLDRRATEILSYYTRSADQNRRAGATAADYQVPRGIPTNFGSSEPEKRTLCLYVLRTKAESNADTQLGLSLFAPRCSSSRLPVELSWHSRPALQKERQPRRSSDCLCLLLKCLVHPGKVALMTSACRASHLSPTVPFAR